MEFFKGIYYGVLSFDTYSICFAILLFLIVLCLFRAALNLAVLCIGVAALLIGVFDYSPEEIYHTAHSAIVKAKESAKKYVEPILQSQLADAEIRHNEDGTFEVIAGEVTIKGKKDSHKVTMYFKGEKLDIGIEEFSDGINEALSSISEGADDISAISLDANKTEEKQP